jgi:hypothetical protein
MNGMEKLEIYFGHGVAPMFPCWHFPTDLSFWDLGFHFGRQQWQLF